MAVKVELSFQINHSSHNEWYWVYRLDRLAGLCSDVMPTF